MTTGSSVWSEATKILVQAGRGLAILVVILSLLEAVLGLAVLWLIKALIEALNEEGLSGAVNQQLLLLFGTMVLAALVGVWVGFLRVRQGIAVSEVVDGLIHNKAVSIDFGFYESPAYFDSLERARQAGAQRPAQMIGSALLLLKSLGFLLGSAVLLATIDWRILPALFLSIVVVLAVRLKFTLSLFEWRKSRAEFERHASYTDLLITSDHHAKDLRLNDMGCFLQSQYRDIRSKINDGHVKIERRKALAEMVASLLVAAVFFGGTAVLVLSAGEDPNIFGDLVLFILVFRRAEVSGREMVQSLSKLYDDRLFLRQLFDFLGLQSRLMHPAQPQLLPKAVENSLVVESVSFSYPNSEKRGLHNINLELSPGKIVALVGENGSGKTTLVKLLTRLYDPDEGRIELDGVDTRCFDPDAFRSLFSVVFQNFACYATTLRDNVAAGDMARASNDDEILSALKRASAIELFDQLPSGLDTMLTKMFREGHELSIGQWQRIALARAFFRRSDFLILDEPSSALDPRAEYELFENLRERCDGRGVLLISHRLSTVRMADYTYVMDGGRIIEEGSHDDLATANGRYSELFELQGRRYR